MATNAKKMWTALTVTVGTTRARLLDLIQAVDPDCPTMVREWSVQNDPDNSPGGQLTGAILIGDGAVAFSPLRCGVKISQDLSRNFVSSNAFRAPFDQVYVVTDDDDILLNVAVWG